jgi:hypothetical protein
MLALVALLSPDARAVDLRVGVPIRRDPFSAFTTEVANGVATPREAEGDTLFRGELSAALPFADLGASAEWMVDVGFRTWQDVFRRDARELRAWAHEPRADVGVQIGTRHDAAAHAYASVGVGVMVSVVTSSDWRTYGFPSPHAFLAAGLSFGSADTRGLVELRVSPVLRDDTYTREALLDGGGAGLRFTPGGGALTVSAGVRLR